MLHSVKTNPKFSSSLLCNSLLYFQAAHKPPNSIVRNSPTPNACKKKCFNRTTKTATKKTLTQQLHQKQ